jgi:cephalosporin hydroxylase
MSTKRVVLIATLSLVCGVFMGQLGAREAPDQKEATDAQNPPGSLNDSSAQLVHDFHLLVYRSWQWDHLSWLGVHAQQNPNDVWSYQQIFFETKPDFVIEAGTNQGGGTLVWATLLAAINPAAKVLTIDIEDRLEAARKVPLFNEKAEFFHGSSTSDEVVTAIRKRVQNKRALVILDSNHQKSHVLKEMGLYGDLVPVGGYLLVQDTDVNGHPAFPKHGPGPWEAVEEFMAAGGRSQGGATFQIDRSREILLFSMHPIGYLKRVK